VGGVELGEKETHLHHHLGDEVRVGETFDVITVAGKRRKKKVGGGCKAMVVVGRGGIGGRRREVEVLTSLVQRHEK
jgi:hypothetical protein